MKMRTARYIGELVKFKIAHHSVAFNCWNFCMKDFGSQTVYIVSALLESCGRWLYRNSETNSRCQEFLERMMKLKVGKFFDDNLKMTIDNAYYSCIPQERTITPRKIYPLIHQYIRKLLFVDLKNVSTIIAVVEHLLRLEWDSDCFFIIRNAFLEIENIEYSNLDLMAQVIYHLNKFTNIGVLLLDDIIEEIQYGMEINNFWEYQQRIAFARYFAELYNSRIASSKVVFSVMYLLLNFGHDFSKEGTSESKLDTPRDTIRIRLITTILEHTGKQLDQQNRNELSLFLLHFQRYILQKELIPVDLEFLLDDLFTRLRPSMSRFRNMKDCDEEISKLQSVIKSDGIKDQPQLQPSDELKYMDTADLKNDSEIKFTELDDDSGGDEEEDDDEEEEQEEDEDEEDEEYPDDNELEDDEEENAKAYDWSHRGLQNRTVGNSVEDEEFLRQLDNTFVEDVESRKFESRTIRNLVDAETLAIQALSKSSRASETKSQQASDLVRGFVPMQFLTRRNKGILARQIEVPEAEKIVENLGSADHAANHKKEQLLMKKLVQAGINRTADDH
jgi:regulator of nonsense transcripts 2